MPTRSARGTDAEPVMFPDLDVAPAVDLTAEVERHERRRAQWRAAQKRMRARRKAYAGSGWVDPDASPRGLGDGKGGRPAVVREE